MNSLNNVQLIGNITAPADIKLTTSGARVASFSIATNRSWKDANGRKQEQVEYHSVTAWSGLAEIVEKYTTKGAKVYVSWRLQTTSWESQPGEKRYKTQIVAENIILLGSRGPQNTQGTPQQPEDWANVPQSESEALAAQKVMDAVKEKDARRAKLSEWIPEIADIPF